MTRMFGMGDDFGEDAILGKLEGMKDVIEQVNKQFKDPVRITFSFCLFVLEMMISCLSFKEFWLILLQINTL